MNIKLPIEKQQKFQIGDICKIVEKGIFEVIVQYPPYWGSNFSNYSVYLLPRNKNEYAGNLAWIEENQLRFIRKSTEKEITIVIQEDNKMLSYKNCPYTSIFNETKHD